MAAIPKETRDHLIRHALLVYACSDLRDFKFDQNIKNIWANGEDKTFAEIRDQVVKSVFESIYGSRGGVETIIEEAEHTLVDLLQGKAAN